jgi:CheY-like chemotaxis protein
MSFVVPLIMVVEDESLLLQAVTKKLQLNNMKVLPFMNGQEAVAYLESGQEVPDAIWLDYYLKDMNGLSFMEELKKNEKWSKIPVLVVSNSATPAKVHNMLALGAKKYLLKAEHRLDELVSILQEFIVEEGKEIHA